MKRMSSGLVAAAVLALGASLAAQSSVSEITFDSTADLLKTPNDTYVGEVGGVGTNSRGQIFVYTRTGHPYATLGDNRTFYRGGSRLLQAAAVGAAALPGQARPDRRSAARPMSRGIGRATSMSPTGSATPIASRN